MARRSIDWEALKREYRTDAFTNRQLADKFGCTEGAIRAKVKAKPEEWVKDLAKAVEQATQAKLLRTDLRTADACVDAQIVDEVADQRVALVLRHRRALGRDSARVERLAGKLDALLDGVEDLKGIASAQEIAESMARTRARIIPLERQAFGLASTEAPGGKDAEPTVIILPHNGRD